MNINMTSGSLTGFQTTDGGYKYRRVQTVQIGSGYQTGLLDLESKFSTDGKGIGRLLVRCEMPYFTVNTASCCCDESGASPSYVPSGKIAFHTVLTLPKAAIADIKSADGPKAAAQIAAIMGMTLGMGNIIHGTDRLVSLDTNGAVVLNTTSDSHGILQPTGSVIRGIMGVTPLPPEGYEAVDSLSVMNGGRNPVV